MFGFGVGEIVGAALALAFVIFLGFKIFGPKKTGGAGGGGGGGGGDSDTHLN